MNELLIKKLISVFLKKDAETIVEDTIIDTSVIQGSVLFHRMIARINDLLKIEIENYEKIHTYRDLFSFFFPKVHSNVEE